MTYEAIIEYLINELGYTRQQAEREIAGTPIKKISTKKEDL